ncbi:MAG: hypothetical protein ACFB15_10985 [Cyclobacteriaceae bacterium]
MLGIISNRTKGSWWVPFELGYSWNRKITVAQLPLEEVDELPSYLKISELLKDSYDLKAWINKDRKILELKKNQIPSLEKPNIPGVKKVSFKTISFT